MASLSNAARLALLRHGQCATGAVMTRAGLHTTPAAKLYADKDGRYKCTLIPGDGVGPELMDSVQEVVKAIGAPVDFEQFHLSEVSSKKYVLSCT